MAARQTSRFIDHDDDLPGRQTKYIEAYSVNLLYNPVAPDTTMLYSTIAQLVFGIGAAAQVTYQNSSGTRLRVDNGTHGPEIEEVHYC